MTSQPKAAAEINMSRIWAMPNKWTFTILPIKNLLSKHTGEGFWCDPFSGKHSPAHVRNDLNSAMNTAQFHMDALAFLKSRKDEEFDGVLFDPPYSITQAKQCYDSFGAEKLSIHVSNMAYWSGCKNEIARILKRGGVAICFGWNSMGLGKNRGFKMSDVLLVPHGGSKNDTIVTVEQKL